MNKLHQNNKYPKLTSDQIKILQTVFGRYVSRVYKKMSKKYKNFELLFDNIVNNFCNKIIKESDLTIKQIKPFLNSIKINTSIIFNNIK